MQDNLKIPAAEKESLIQSISQRLARSSPQPSSHSEPPTDTLSSPIAEASTHLLVSVLAQIAASKAGQYSPNLLASLSSQRTFSTSAALLPPLNDYVSIFAASRELPAASEANIWLENFFHGPNRVFTTVTAGEGRRLFQRHYSLAESLDSQEVCLLTYILAAGARYTEGVTSNVYLRLTHQARGTFERCANKAFGSQLWALQPLLLNCLISMHTEPATCWFTLGKLQMSVRS